MLLGKRKYTNPPDSDLDASAILELLINADFCLQTAARSAIEAKAFTLSAELSNARRQVVEQIFALIRDRREIVRLMTPPAQNLFKEFIDCSERGRDNGAN